MDIVILAHFCMDFTSAGNGRFTYLANMLSQEHDVELITSDFFHTGKRKRKEIPMGLPYAVTLIEEPGYTRNISFQRIRSHKIWGTNVKAYLEKRRIPDILYCSVPSLDGAYYAALYCKINHIKFIIDIQDLWPEAFEMMLPFRGLAPLMFRKYRKRADYIYRSADQICAVSETYMKRAQRVNLNADDAITVYLGTDLDRFDSYSKASFTKEENHKFCVAYCGTIGKNYDLRTVVNAVASMHYTVQLIIMGDGPDKKKIQKYVKRKQIDAVFTGYLDYPKMCSLLKSCDIAVNPIKRRSAASIINKHADYTAAGLAIISTQRNREFRQLLQDYDMGFFCKNAKEMAKTMDRLYEDDSLRMEMGKNARRCAKELFDRKTTYSRIVEVVNNLKRK